MKWLVRMLKVGRIAGRGGGGLSRALILSRGVSLHRKHWRLMFGLQTYNFPAKNASSSKVTGSHIKRERERGREWVSVQMCLCASTHVHVHWDYRKFTECKTEIYKAKPAESIISCTTTLTSQMTIFGLGAARPHVLVSGLSVLSYILGVCDWTFGWDLVLFQICKRRRRSKCLNSQRKEVGREEREIWGGLRGDSRQNTRWTERLSEWQKCGQNSSQWWLIQ